MPRRRELAPIGRLSSLIAGMIIMGIACRADRALGVDDAVDGADALTLDAPLVLTTPTYDGSGQAVHGAGKPETSEKLVWRTAVQRRRRQRVFDRTGGSLASDGRVIPKPIKLINPP